MRRDDGDPLILSKVRNTNACGNLILVIMDATFKGMSRSSFLSLPFDLRLEVYKLVLVPSETLINYDYSPCTGITVVNSDYHRPPMEADFEDEYEEALGMADEGDWQIEDERHDETSSLCYSQRAIVFPEILQTCRTIYFEAWPIFYCHNKLFFRDPLDFAHSFMSSLTPLKLGHVRYLEFGLGMTPNNSENCGLTLKKELLQDVLELFRLYPEICSMLETFTMRLAIHEFNELEQNVHLASEVAKSLIEGPLEGFAWDNDFYDCQFSPDPDSRRMRICVLHLYKSRCQVSQRDMYDIFKTDEAWWQRRMKARRLQMAAMNASSTATTA